MRGWLLAIVLLTFVVLYGSADLVTSLHSWRIPLGETAWPFWPDWAAVYISLDLLIPLSFLLLSRERLGPFTMAMLLATLWAWPCFLLLPFAPVPPPQDSPGGLFWLADQLNLDGNLLPSLHVAYAVLCAGFLRRWWATLWAVAIALSTLLTHQHYTVDALAGLILAGLAFRWVEGRGRIEALCLGELARCAGRHRRYALIGVALFAASVGRWKKRRLARVGFCYLQRLDDLLDGQESSEVEPEEIATLHQQALRGEREFPEDILGELGKAFLQEVLQRGEGVDMAVEVIEEMKLDRIRVRDERLLEEDELDRHLERTFELSLDLMLLAADSPLRSKRAPHLLKALGWCSVIRDFEEDQSLGLVNVPKEVWLSGESRIWFEQRHRQVQSDLAASQSEIDKLKGQPGAGLLRIFHRSVERYARDPKKAIPQI